MNGTIKMSSNQIFSPPFSYKGGKSVTEKLKVVTKCKTYDEMAVAFDIPKSTIFTWHTRDMTPYEIAIRTHLITGVSLKWLLLDEGEAFSEGDTFNTVATDSKRTVSIETISNGELSNSSQIGLDFVAMKNYGLTVDNTRIINLDGTLLFINTAETKANSGRYLLDIDGSISINHLQRLPGKKLAMSYGNTSVEVAEADIVVLGRVVLAMEKE
ncbi:helix-turn-helix domain-containing protein [Moritella viscosa]